ncbi:MAG: LamG domain-containing protein [Pseudomonadota bacterium]
MGNKVRWRDNNLAEEGHRIYRSATPMDPENLPAPVDAVGANVETWEDGDVTEGQTYYYRVGSFVGGVEKVSAELEVLAEESTLKNGLLAFYTMDEVEGDQLLAEPGYEPVNGTITGSITQVPGVLGQALEFHGYGEFVELGSPGWFTETESFTICFFARIDALSVDQDMLYRSDAFYSSSNENTDFGINYRYTTSSGSQLRFFAYTGSTPTTVSLVDNPEDPENYPLQDLQGPYPIVAGEWFHVTAVLDSGTMRIYFNGELKHELPLENGAAAINYRSAAHLYLGRRYTGSYSYSEWWDGGMDQLRFYARALSAGEVFDAAQEGGVL